MKEEVIDSITSKLKNWEYDESDIEEASEIFEKYIEANEDVVDYIVTDASDSVPNRYDNHALDVLFLTKSNIFFIIYNSEVSKYNSNTIEEIHSVSIEVTSQRIELAISSNSERIGVASYDEDQFEAIRTFGLNIDRIVRE